MKKIFLAAACAFFMAVPAALAQKKNNIQTPIEFDGKNAKKILKTRTKNPQVTF